MSNLLQNPYVLLVIKIGLLLKGYPTKILSFLFLSKVLVFINIIMYEIDEELLCYTKCLQFILLTILFLTKQENKINTLQSLILIFSGKKGLVMFALSDGIKENIKLSEQFLPYINYLIS